MAGTKTEASCRRALGVRDVLGRLGDKWSLVLVMALDDGPLRFGEIKRSIEGISQRMLTLTLKSLERDGIVIRKVLPSSPPRVDYDLTALGRTLLVVFRALAVWAEEHRDEVLRARERFDRAMRTGGG